jgi:hypothetical protein
MSGCQPTHSSFSCSQADASQNKDAALWRDVLLARYDDPRAAGAFPVERKEVAWSQRLQDRVFADRVFAHWDEEKGPDLVGTETGRRWLGG